MESHSVVVWKSSWTHTQTASVLPFIFLSLRERGWGWGESLTLSACAVCVCVCVCVCVSLSLSVCVSLSHSLSACVCLSLESMSWKGRVGDPYPLISPLGGIFFAVLLKTKGLCVQFQHFGTVHTEGTATDVVDLLCNTRFHKSQRVLCASLKKKKKKGGGCQLRQRRLTGNAPRHAYM